MTMSIIRVDTFLIFSNGVRERKEFEFEVSEPSLIRHGSLVSYIMDNTPNCINVSILDVWHEVRSI